MKNKIRQRATFVLYMSVKQTPYEAQMLTLADCHIYSFEVYCIPFITDSTPSLGRLTPRSILSDFSCPQTPRKYRRRV